MLRFTVLMAACACVFGLEAPSDLRVEGLLSEVATISEPLPRFSFTPPSVPGGKYGAVQQSYSILVTDRDTMKTVWDSKVVKSSSSSEIVYDGSALTPMTRYSYNVTVTVDSESSSASGYFETGPMTGKDWQGATWLTGTQFRREFEVPAGKDISFARAYVAAPGCAVVEINGQSPAVNLRGICPWVVSVNTQQNTRYMTHDITAGVTSGKNAIGVVAGQVMESVSQFIAVVVVRFKTGEAMVFTSGSTGWMMRNESYLVKGEAWATTIDWMSWEPTWSKPGGANAFWKPVVGQAGQIPLRALQMPHSAVLDEVKPVKVQALADGDFLYTFPKNFVGTVRIAALPNAADSSSISVMSGEWLVDSRPAPPSPPNNKPAQCVEVDEQTRALLGGCPNGGRIESIEFASFGTPTGSCKTGFKTDEKCNSAKSMAVVKSTCLGKKSCVVPATDVEFGDPCNGVRKKLAVKIGCTSIFDNETSLETPVVSPSLGNMVTTTTTVSDLPPLPPPGNGTYPIISGKQQQYEVHSLRSNNPNDLETAFCWHGFQYVRITPSSGSTFKGTLDSIVGLEIHTNMRSTGNIKFGGDGVGDSIFEKAAAVLNGIYSMTIQSQKTNVAAYMPTDCPTREKHGWMGDALDASEEALYNFDIFAVHTAFMQTIQDNQGSSGDVPVVIPAGVPGETSCHDIAWTSAYPQICNMLYKYYGDMRLIQRHWTSLVSYQENLILNAMKNPNMIAECDQFKDWLCGNAQSCCTNAPTNSTCPVGPEMGSFNYVLGLKAMSEMATVLGNTSAAKRYASLADSGTVGFHKTFYSPEFKQYGGDIGATQSLNVPAIKIKSPPGDLFPTVLQTLASDVSSAGLRVGAVTSKVLLDVLSDNDEHDIAVKTATATTEPSWGYWWTQNSTTCWESWPEGHGTRNHIFLCGGVVEWMWKYLIGITPTAPKFTQVSIAPRVSVLGPATASGDFRSPSGVISSSWSIAVPHQVTVNASLPSGVQSATIVVPKPFGTPSPAPPSTQCADNSERNGAMLSLGCSDSGGTISSIDFASFGTPQVSGACATWTSNASCNAANSTEVVTAACKGKSNCSISFHTGASPFGDPCLDVVKNLAVRFTCSGGMQPPAPVSNALVYESGTEVWNGKSITGTHPGILRASDVGRGIAFDVVNGFFAFKSTPTN